jgi:hypothetical protein
VSRRVLLLLTLLVATMVCGTALGTAPPAQAANCGKQVIDEYFFSGRLKYHTQECYASALKQVDPDARMYSGIMGAIRAARARDKAADAKANEPATTESTPVDTQPVDTTPVETLPVPTEVVPTETIEPTITAEARTGAVQTQAALDVAGAEADVPLPVIVLAGLAVLLTVVGLGGLAVHCLDRGYATRLRGSPRALAPSRH